MNSPLRRLLALAACVLASRTSLAAAPPKSVAADDPAVQLFPLSAVWLLDGPFIAAVRANREYMLALEPDRLLAPFVQEAGIKPRAGIYDSWESGGLGGHTGGHYLAALADLLAAGADTPDGELRRRLDYTLSALERCQQASGDGYIGGVAAGRALWAEMAAGHFKTTGDEKYLRLMRREMSEGPTTP